MCYHHEYGEYGVTVLFLGQTEANTLYCLFKGRYRSFPAGLPLLVILCNKMAVVPDSGVLTFSIFKWSSYSSTYLPE